MGMAFRIMILVICLNIAIALLQYAGGSDNWVAEGSQSYMTKGQEQVNNIMGLYNSSTNTGSIDQTSVVWYRSILDLISVGFFGKILGVIHDVLYGLPSLLYNLKLIDYGFIVFLNSLLTLLYFLGMWELWTGRDLTFR